MNYNDEAGGLFFTILGALLGIMLSIPLFSDDAYHTMELICDGEVLVKETCATTKKYYVYEGDALICSQSYSLPSNKLCTLITTPEEGG